MNTTQLNGMIYGALAADSLSLGSHWVYNTNAISKRLGVPDTLTDPIVKSFHPTRKRGEFSHYGDQLFWLLEFIAAEGGYDHQRFFTFWKDRMSSYDGYFDHATKETLETGRASSMDDLGGAARTSALALLYHDTKEQLARTAAEHARLTHDHPLVADTARFFSYLLFEGAAPIDTAIQSVVASHSWESELFQPAVALGLESAHRDTTEAITELGQMCTASRALPSAVHLLVRYGDDYRASMIANTAAGGDSAARGLLTGMILGARGGFDAIPKEWIGPLVYRERIAAAAGRIAQISG
jgi:ADP-ribosylglycohydrolase